MRMITGGEYLAIARELQDRCAVATDERAEALHPKIPGMLEVLGTATFVLEQYAACVWGCRGAPHTMERFAARTISYSLAMLRLLWFGHYDEAFSLVRNLGELANLLLLFAQDKTELSAWIAADQNTRRSQFGAFAVRKRLGENNVPIPLNRDRFNELSARYSHSGQEPAPQMHNLLGIPNMGGRVQPDALIQGLMQLGLFGAITISCIAELGEMPSDKQEQLRNAATRLGDCTSQLASPPAMNEDRAPDF